MASIAADLLESLLHMSESEMLDFKRDQYPFAGASEDQKSELVKDILAFANAWKTNDAYILIGADEIRGQRATVVGVAEHLADADLQQLVNKKTNTPVSFSYIATKIDGVDVGVIRINAQQSRPVYLNKKFGKVQADEVYLRRGSSTDVAKPGEIARMGLSLAVREEPRVAIEWYDPVAKSVLSPARIVSKILPPRAKPKPPPEFEELFAPNSILGMLSAFSKDEAAAKAYEIRRRRMVEVAILVRNSGRVLLRDVRIRMDIPKREDLEITDRGPEPPRDAFHFAPSIPVARDIHISERDDRWLISVRVGKIQAGNRIVSDSLWVGSACMQDVPFSATVFADEFTEPLKVEVPLAIETAADSRDA